MKALIKAKKRLEMFVVFQISKYYTVYYKVERILVVFPNAFMCYKIIFKINIVAALSNKAYIY